jgi:putative phosphonate transport system ATP-binding protein
MSQPEDDRPLLLAEDLSKWYGGRLGCRDVSFAVHEGEVIAVVGESGSGKSTLLQLLSTQLAPSRGRVLYLMRDGATRDLALLGEAERRFLFAPTGATCIRIPRSGCACRYRRAPMSANG